MFKNLVSHIKTKFHILKPSFLDENQVFLWKNEFSYDGIQKPSFFKENLVFDSKTKLFIRKPSFLKNETIFCLFMFENLVSHIKNKFSI